ncbi:hypothetical protein VEx25_A1223 [Vibrio antiquarius]|uniref:Uncharacterized protein n=2 Tax=Vibrio antiquarius (strain Ex25) TaxID=150340 RepID=A0ACA6QTL8_VIBAE|nr:hypothetical protein VEA_001214 [Vibrio antiquarius]EDN57553.1 hypothetical protein VEx25_A1223 [Vibrio antiquarius]
MVLYSNLKEYLGVKHCFSFDNYNELTSFYLFNLDMHFVLFVEL